MFMPASNSLSFSFLLLFLFLCPSSSLLDSYSDKELSSRLLFELDPFDSVLPLLFSLLSFLSPFVLFLASSFVLLFAFLSSFLLFSDDRLFSAFLPGLI